jgi:alkylhydroperoxidase family enzyme
MDKLRQILPLPTDKWAPELAPVASDMKNAPLNVHKLMAHNQTLLSAWWDFRNHSVNGGTLGPRLAELVILRVSVHLGAWYEWGSHVDRAVRIGMDMTDVNAVLERDIADTFPAHEGLILRAVDDLMTLREIRDDTRRALENHLSTEQIMDVIAIHGMYVTLGCMIGTWGLELDHDVAERIRTHTSIAAFNAASERFNA